jgi:hypothetical protein
VTCTDRFLGSVIDFDCIMLHFQLRDDKLCSKFTLCKSYCGHLSRLVLHTRKSNCLTSRVYPIFPDQPICTARCLFEEQEPLHVKVFKLGMLSRLEFASASVFLLMGADIFCNVSSGVTGASLWIIHSVGGDGAHGICGWLSWSFLCCSALTSRVMLCPHATISSTGILYA